MADKRRLRQIEEAADIMNGKESKDGIILPPWEELLEELTRRRLQSAVPDGYPTSSMSDGGSSGSSDSSSAERAAMHAGLKLLGCRRPLFVNIRGHRHRVCSRCGYDDTQHHADPIGDTVEELFDLIDQATKALRSIPRKYSVVVNAADGRRGRQTSVGLCLACEAGTTGCGDDRLKSGYCPRCYTAWRRYIRQCEADGTEYSHAIFRRWRRPDELAEEAEQQAKEGAA